MSDGRRWVLSALACGLALAAPGLLVPFPVSADLPQHLGQVRLFFEALAQPSGPYAIQWLTPYLLGYLGPALVWLLSPPALAGGLTLALAALTWSGAMHLLAARLGRGAQAPVLACLPFFGASLQWGFLSFLFGVGAFALWLLATRAALDAPRPARAGALAGLAALGLYATHLLWLGAAGVVAAALVLRRRALRPAAWVLAWHLPALGLAAASAAYLHQTFDNPTVWGPGPLPRLAPGWWGQMGLGPSLDLAPTALLAGLLGLAGLGLWQRRAELDRPARDLLTVAGLFALFALALPLRYTNTVQFESRWASPALAFLALGAPAPALRRALAPLAAAALLAAGAASTAAAWWRVNEEELTGLEAALAALPPAPRVLGLDFLKTSRQVAGVPFLQTFAWAQVRRGGSLNFSFADFTVMPVVFKARGHPWTSGLEWFPDRVRPEDFRAFDFALVSGPEEVHLAVQRRPELEPVTTEGLWRLYRVRRPPGPM